MFSMLVEFFNYSESSLATLKSTTLNPGNGLKAWGSASSLASCSIAFFGIRELGQPAYCKMGTKRPRSINLEKAETINVGVIVKDGAIRLEKKIISLEEKVDDMVRRMAYMDSKIDRLFDLINSLIEAKHSKEDPESREKTGAAAKKFRHNFEFDASLSGMGGMGRKKSPEVHIVLSDSSEEVSSKRMSSKNDTKSPLKSKGVEDDFSKEEKNVLKYIFDVNHSPDEKIVEMSGEFGERTRLTELQTSNWLSAEILNLYACMLRWDNRNDASKLSAENWFMPTYVSQYITRKKTIHLQTIPFLYYYRAFHERKNGCDAGRIYRYFLREDKYGGDIKKCEKIFIPMNPGDHWYLCVVDIIRQEVLILDSLMPKNCSKRISSAKVVLKYFHEALEIGCGTTYSVNISKFPTKIAQWAPQQKNLYDCGLFTIRFMQLYDELRVGMHFSIENSHLERRKIAIEIFYHEANEAKEEILRKIAHSSKDMDYICVTIIELTFIFFYVPVTYALLAFGAQFILERKTENNGYRAAVVAVQGVSAAMASGASVLVTMPLDTIKTRLQVLDGGEPCGGKGKSMTVMQTVRDLVKEGGLRACYRGLSPRWASMSMSATTMITTYEFLKRLSTKSSERFTAIKCVCMSLKLPQFICTACVFLALVFSNGLGSLLSSAFV
ncbi:mitochondrial substrate carrier family protein [Striga asiatica]|uniref:Mitochondrial substrate carrier family protein n=1 Tax=Striga asiatica TaxID=4170 RepID=A0A5A7PBJ0_STRAF|nr:mitochondrial substrate carrier family protein [Striga asiatica]